MIGLGSYLILATLVFGTGAAGFVLRRNLLIQLMCVELMLNAVNMLLIAFNRFSPEKHTGQTFAFFIIAVAAAEAAVGLSILINFYRLKRSVDAEEGKLLRH